VKSPEVTVMASKRRAAARPLRWLARLLITPSGLRRRSDRIEGVIVMLLSAAFLAVVAAAPLIGDRVYHAERADAAGLHLATAVLTQNGPVSTSVAMDGQAVARWRAPDGQPRSGILTTETVPGLWNASAGDRVRVWLTGSGQPESRPPGPLAALFASIVITVGIVLGVAIAAFVCYWLCRLALDRRRLAAWASEWSMTGPRWTTRL
jgi:hypothetical protein